MNKHTNQRGYILVLTLLILSITVMVVTQLFQRGGIYLTFARSVIDREKAKAIAVGGIQLAMSQLAVSEPEEKEQEDKKKSAEKPGEKEKKLLKRILPVLNRWQLFELHQDIDGVDGTISLCISCEDGKININQLFNFAQKKFKEFNKGKDEIKKAFESLFVNLRPFVNKNLFAAFEKFLKQRQYKLDDVTELLLAKEFQQQFRPYIFYKPPYVTKGKRGRRPVFLTDIFTIWSEQEKLNPWLLSDSISALLQLKRAEAQDTVSRKKKVEAWLKDFTPSAESIEKLWEKTALKEIYGKDYKSIPKNLGLLLNPTFVATTFSVLVTAQVGEVTQKVFAILQQEKPSEFLIKKLYWI